MSYGSEYLADTTYEREQATEWFERLAIRAAMEASHGIWRTKEGKILSVKEMETSHIKNCIKMLQRNNATFADVYIPMFEKELAERKEE